MSDIFILDESLNSDVKKNTNSKKISKLNSIDDFLLSLQWLNVKDKVIFYRLLSTMINAWITLTKAISILEKQEKKQSVMKWILNWILLDLKEWKSLSQCLWRYSNSFWPAEIWMIESWEKTWKLNTSLNDLANQIEKIASINWKLKSAMMYPAMIVLVLIWVIFVMMTMVVPKLLDIFSWGDNLPASTKLLISVSDFFVWYWWLMIWFFLVVFIFCFFWWKTLSWRYYLDKLILKIPIPVTTV